MKEGSYERMNELRMNEQRYKKRRKEKVPKYIDYYNNTIGLL